MLDSRQKGLINQTMRKLSIKHGGDSILVWDCINYYSTIGPGLICNAKGRMNQLYV